ncbi:MAG: hypothetical protein HXX09_02695 [Bacteroidetes bacterium]|nr:hypothetical protein [Bacteroidota bacterium]
MKSNILYTAIFAAFIFSGNLFAQKDNLYASNNITGFGVGEPKGIVVKDDNSYETTTPITISNFIITDLETKIVSTNSTLEVIPIASSNNILVNIKNDSEQYYIIELFNTSGATIYHKTIKSNSIQKKIDLSAFPKGDFTLKVSSQFGNVVKYYNIEQL